MLLNLSIHIFGVLAGRCSLGAGLPQGPFSYCWFSSWSLHMENTHGTPASPCDELEQSHEVFINSWVLVQGRMCHILSHL